jgi:hypothetical protein
MSDEEIEANAAADEENPPLDAAFFRAMKPLSTARKQRVTMFLDDDVLAISDVVIADIRRGPMQFCGNMSRRNARWQSLRACHLLHFERCCLLQLFADIPQDIGGLNG